MSKMNDNSLTRIEEFRKQRQKTNKKLTQKYLCEAIGLSRTTYMSNLKKGGRLQRNWDSLIKAMMILKIDNKQLPEKRNNLS